MAATSGPDSPHRTVPSMRSGPDASPSPGASTAPAAEPQWSRGSLDFAGRVAHRIGEARPNIVVPGMQAFGRRALVLGGLVATLALAMLVSLVVAGPTGVPIPPGTIAALALGWIPFLHVPHTWGSTQATIVLQ